MSIPPQSEPPADLQLLLVSPDAELSRNVSAALAGHGSLNVLAGLAGMQAMLEQGAGPIEARNSRVLLVDGGMPDADVLALIDKVQALNSLCPVILLADPDRHALTGQALETGIHSYVFRDCLQLLSSAVSAALTWKARQLELEQVHRALRMSEERYRDIFDNTSDLIQCLSPDGRFLYTNRAWREAMGYSEAEIDGLSLFDVLHKESQACCQERFERLKKGVCLEQVEFKFKARDGHSVSLYGDCGSIIKDGATVSTRGIFRNITEQKRSESALHRVEERFQDLYDNTPDMYFSIAADGSIASVNRYGAGYLGYAVDELRGRPISKLCHADDIAALQDRLARAFGGETVRDVETRKLRKDGSILWTHERFRLSPGDPRQLQILCRDMTEARLASAALRESEERFRALYHDNPSMFLSVDQQGVIRSVNRYGAEQLGYAPEELIGRPLTVLHADSLESTLWPYFNDVLMQPDKVARRELEAKRKDGSLFWMRETVRAVSAERGERRLLLVCEDITQERTLSEQLSHQASHDPLTDLVNRREFEKRLERLIHFSHGGDIRHAMCYLDLDGFKQVNDQFGHLLGDVVLQEVAALLAESVRQRDTLARLGGDEFAILMEHCPLDKAYRVAEQCLAAIAQLDKGPAGEPLKLGVSIGLVPIDQHSLTVDRVLKAADAACYRAKDEGRNRIFMH